MLCSLDRIIVMGKILSHRQSRPTPQLDRVPFPAAGVLLKFLAAITNIAPPSLHRKLATNVFMLRSIKTHPN